MEKSSGQKNDSKMQELCDQFEEGEFYVSQGVIYCSFCNCSITAKASNMETHKETLKHQENMRQPKIFDHKEVPHPEVLTRDTVKFLLENDICLEKYEAFRTFLIKRLPNAGRMHRISTVKEKILPEIHNKMAANISLAVKNQLVSVIIDETSDKLTNNVVNTIIQPLNQCNLF